VLLLLLLHDKGKVATMASNAHASSSKHTLDIPELALPNNVAAILPVPPFSPAAPVSTQARKETDFQRYLAGQSVMKSGLTRDQAEVNKIIANASKDSKFFKREKEKDELLVKRIEGLMRKVRSGRWLVGWLEVGDQDGGS
jgi:hypothetical protein